MAFRAVVPNFAAFEVWRGMARGFASCHVAADAISWLREGTPAGLFDELWDGGQGDGPRRSVTAPKAYLALAETLVCHADPRAFDVLYRLLLRLQGEPSLLDNGSDVDVVLARAMASEVRRDAHKMKAFVRFKEVEAGDAGRRRFAAWFEPGHFIVDGTAPFFARRFADMDWAIVTPKGTARFHDKSLSYAPFEGRPPDFSDGVDDLWRAYFANIFNPARLKVKAMQSQMPKKYWRNLPEATLIPELIATSEQRAAQMQAQAPTPPPAALSKIKAKAAPVMPALEAGSSLDDVRAAAAHCQLCPLHLHATQTVFGEGDAHAKIMFVGEQPGDQEDLAGRPFVGPAGAIFDSALSAAGISRTSVYVTNAVKHFKFSPRGKRRIHERPTGHEILMCMGWLQREIAPINPTLVVAMGASALQALTGDGSGISSRRGTVSCMADGRALLVTYHPAAILRVPDAALAARMRAEFLSDLKASADLLQAGDAFSAESARHKSAE